MRDIKLNRHYLLLFLAFGLLGPLLPTLALFLAKSNESWHWDNWLMHYLLCLPTALITGALVWVLKLRRNREGLKLSLTIMLMLALPLALTLGTARTSLASLLASGLAVYLFHCALPRPTADYRPVDRLQRHYCFLFLAMVVLGPLLPTPWLLPNDGLKRLFFLAYAFGLPAALLTGALVWKLKLRRDLSGIPTTVGLAFVLAMLVSPSGPLLGLYGAGSALCFCPFLPRPEQKP